MSLLSVHYGRSKLFACRFSTRPVSEIYDDDITCRREMISLFCSFRWVTDRQIEMAGGWNFNGWVSDVNDKSLLPVYKVVNVLGGDY